MRTYEAISKDNADLLDRAGELVLGHAPLVLNVEELEGLGQEHGLLRSGRALLRQLGLEVLFKPRPPDASKSARLHPLNVPLLTA